MTDKLTQRPTQEPKGDWQRALEVAKLVVTLGSDDPRISDEDRLLALRDNSPLVGEARLVVASTLEEKP